MQKRARRRQGTWLCPLFCCLLFCLSIWSVPVLADGATKNQSRQSSPSSSVTLRPANTAELTRQLRQAIANSDIETFDRLTGGDTSHNRVGMDAKGRTALMYAAKIGNLAAVHKLIRLDSKGIWNWNQQTYGGQPVLRGSNKPLHVGEYINLCDTANDDDPNDSTYGYTALMYASDNKHVQVVNYLLNAGADPTKKCKFAQFTALQLAQNAGDTLSVAAIERKINEDAHQLSSLQWWTSFLSSPSNFTTPFFAFTAWMFYLVFWKGCWVVRKSHARHFIQARVNSDNEIHVKDQHTRADAITKEFLREPYFRDHRKRTPSSMRKEDEQYLAANYFKIKSKLYPPAAFDTDIGDTAP